MTPMQSLKNQFDTFSKHVSKYCTEVNLNKSKPKESITYFHEKQIHINKGVKSDFIKCFKFTKDDFDYSLGFEFIFLNHHNEIINKDSQRVKVSIKKDMKIEFLEQADFFTKAQKNNTKNFHTSIEYKIDDFMQKMNDLNKILEISNDKTSLIQETQLIFDINQHSAGMIKKMKR